MPFSRLRQGSKTIFKGKIEDSEAAAMVV